MNERPVEPLSPEERALAERLARLGPHDGPSPALDARILAAAHQAAAARPRRARRTLWFGLTPALLTGAGTAAAAALVLALAWQLRPPSAPRVATESDAADEVVMVDAAPAAAQAPAPAPPPPQAAEAERDPARAAPAAVAQARRPQAKAATEAAAPPAAPAALPTAAPAAPQRSEFALQAPPPEPMPLADAPLADAPVASEAAADASASAATAAPPAAAPHPTYTTAARATARLPQARRPAAKPAEDAATAERAAEQPALDRIEVSGSRIAPTADALRAIPVRRDRALEPDAWLERIRARRDAGRDAQARESLRLFRRKHPEAPIPDDLQPLVR